MQNVQFRDTLSPEYVLKGRRSSVVDCGRTCASDVACKAFFFGITSGNCYVSYTEVADTILCVVTAGQFYEGTM
ncbi:hypothetical protein DPMN_151926 [Dreissena polymorpha]|uniref:Apple domain-containing protein n=1 Tax=Dreissena polymorpha TaxID=45954 RepID=A0A9D4FJF7_DREPO|nr:hypothetical protein DPMN_151926 [Dreissena polymorpha]